MNIKAIAANQTEIELPNGTTLFFSYNTPVAAHVPGNGYYRTEKKWGRTTSNHIGQFISRNGGRGAVIEKPQAFFDALV